MRKPLRPLPVSEPARKFIAALSDATHNPPRHQCSAVQVEITGSVLPSSSRLRWVMYTHDLRCGYMFSTPTPVFNHTCNSLYPCRPDHLQIDTSISKQYLALGCSKLHSYSHQTHCFRSRQSCS